MGPVPDRQPGLSRCLTTVGGPGAADRALQAVPPRHWRSGRALSVSAGGTDTFALRAIVEAALALWTEHRPSGWSLEQLEDPVVSCQGDHEWRLADVVSKWVSLKK